MRWTEPWYSAYAVVGMMVLGVAPILIPLTVEAGGKNSAVIVGLVVAAFYFGGLFAPVLGSLTDRRGKQRIVFLATFPIMALAIVGFAFTDRVWLWAIFALIFGGAGSLSGTVAGLFVVEAHPKAEWDDRLSWFRLSYSAGQVVGLIIAALAVSALRLGWLVTAALLVVAYFLGRIRLPALAPALASKPTPTPATAPGRAAASPATPASHPSPSPLQPAKPGRKGSPTFVVFLITWLLTMTGVQTFFNVVPLVMRDGFEVSASASSLLFLLGAAIGTMLYPLGGKMADRSGPGIVLLIGISMTIVAFGAMALAIILDSGVKTIIGSIALVLAATAYSFEVVAATMMVVQVSPGSEGGAVGLLNGIIAGGAVVGALAPSVLAGMWGYGSLPALAFGVLIVAVLVGIPLYRKSVWSQATSSELQAT